MFLHSTIDGVPIRGRPPTVKRSFDGTWFWTVSSGVDGVPSSDGDSCLSPLNAKSLFGQISRHNQPFVSP